MKKLFQVSDTCKRKLKPRKQTSVFGTLSSVYTKKKSWGKLQIAKWATLVKRKLKSRKKDKCLNGDGKTIPSVRHL